MNQSKRDFILSRVPANELFCQLAEECCELAQAALKMARKINGVNPTPKTPQECYQDVIEEIADVKLCLNLLGAHSDEDVISQVCDICGEKQDRWVKRLKEMEGNRGVR